MAHRTEARRRHRRRIFSRLRSNFFTGLVVLAPIALTAWLVWKIVGWIDGIVLPFVPHFLRPDNYIGYNVKGIGVVVFLIFTVLLGMVMKGLIGRSFLSFGERLVDRMPVVRSIYNAIKQIAETVFSQSDRNFDKVCLVEYPRKGTWGLGFISTGAKGVIQTALADHGEMVMVFLPTTPNPTSGFLLAVPKRDVIEIDMSLEDAAKVIISGGLVMPPDAATLQVSENNTPESPAAEDGV